MSNKTQVVLTAVVLETDATLQAGIDYRVLTAGLTLTLPPCQQDDCLVIDALVDHAQPNPTTLSPGQNVTLNGSNHNLSLTTVARTVLRGTGVDAWAIL